MPVFRLTPRPVGEDRAGHQHSRRHVKRVKKHAAPPRIDPVPDKPRRSRNNAFVTATAQAAQPERFPSSRVHSLTRPNLVSVGTIVWLSSELMFFAGLFAMYFTVRANNLDHWPNTKLNL